MGTSSLTTVEFTWAHQRALAHVALAQVSHRMEGELVNTADKDGGKLVCVCEFTCLSVRVYKKPSRGGLPIDVNKWLEVTNTGVLQCGEEMFASEIKCHVL